ncbi:hypothetical protein BDZ89DRAFT_1133956 [Hymenopellis radicata]|nr:hypothetical protein BDZ89DRAFT_1133956 [Hymenopellis radicata]
MSADTIDVARTFGAVLIGGMFASLLSGAVVIQTIIYYKLYPSDLLNLKLVVLTIWILDIFHTSFIWVATWDYLIHHYGDFTRIDHIPWSIALTIVLTAILTFLVHCFFAHRIFRLSKKNWLLTAPILTLAVLRLGAACVTTAKMMQLHTYTEFKADFAVLGLHAGLGLSSAVDVIITGSLFFLLRTSRSLTGAENLNHIIDSLILYAFETGFLTWFVSCSLGAQYLTKLTVNSASTIVAMICWLAMPSNLVFMGLHFVIGKLYANSLLVTLNTRKSIRHGRSVSSAEAAGNAILVMDTRRNRSVPYSPSQITSGDEYLTSENAPTWLQINVQRSIQYTSDYDVPKVSVSVNP